MSSASYSTNNSESSILGAFAVSHLVPSTIATDMEGVSNLHSPISTIAVLMKGNARFLPDGVGLSEGDLVAIPPSYPCQLAPDGETPLEIAAVDFAFTYHGLDFAPFLPDHAWEIKDGPKEQLRESICAICKLELETPSILDVVECLSAGHRIAQILLELTGFRFKSGVGPYNDPEVRYLVNYLQENHHQPLTIDDIAGACGVSRRKLFKIAAKVDKSTPMRLLKSIRLNRSLSLLRGETGTIGEIAPKLGFGDGKNFSREFKRHYGMTPLEYRQRSPVSGKTTSLVLKAGQNLDMDKPRRASYLYERAIEAASANTDLNELYFKAGLALKRAGDLAKAREFWGRVTSLHYRLDIDLETCEDAQKGQACQTVIHNLNRVLTYGNGEQRSRAFARLGEWMFQTAMNGNHLAARNYADLAKKHMAEGSQLGLSLARTLYTIGDYLELERFCPAQDFYLAASLRATGKFDEHLKRFPHMRHQCALARLFRGQFDAVVSEFSDLESPCVLALCAMGKYEDAANAYPNSVAALFALGRFEEIVTAHGESDDRVWGYAGLGQVDNVLEVAVEDESVKARALLYLNETGLVLRSRKTTDGLVATAKLLRGLNLLENGWCVPALEEFETQLPMTHPEHLHVLDFYCPDMVIPLVHHLLKGRVERSEHSVWPSLADHYHRINAHHRYNHAQMLWYDVSFFLGEVDEAGYLAQPVRLRADTDLSLIQGMRADYDGNVDAARACYQTFMARLEKQPHLALLEFYHLPVKMAFVRWRLKELAS